MKVKEGQDEDGSGSRPSVPLRLRRDEERRGGEEKHGTVEIQ